MFVFVVLCLLFLFGFCILCRYLFLCFYLSSFCFFVCVGVCLLLAFLLLFFSAVWLVFILNISFMLYDILVMFDVVGCGCLMLVSSTRLGKNVLFARFCCSV